jgi:excisionase family DNA binding protein
MTQPRPEPAFLSVQEAAAILRITPSAVYNHTRSGDLPTARIARRVVIPRRALDAFRSGRKPKV